jgi:hypothetical protein
VRIVRIGITGHIGLDPGSRGMIYRALCRYLRSFRLPVHGVSCLADGADRLFVNAVLTVRGTFEVVLPVPEGPGPAGRDPELRELLDLAAEVTPITAAGAPEAAYEAANREMLRRIEVLVAVWDGDERGGRGGTSETVALARDLGRTVHVVWPDGASRRSPQSLRASSSASVLMAS